MAVLGMRFVVAQPSGRLGWWGIGIAGALMAVALWWTARGAQISMENLAKGLPYMWDFLSRMMPPNFSFMNKLWTAAFESLYVAIWGTIFGVFLALPFCFSPRAICRRIRPSSTSCGRCSTPCAASTRSSSR